MKKLLIGFLLGISIVARIAYAAPVFNYSRTVIPETNTTYDLGSSTPVKLWNNIYTNNLLVNSQAGTGGCAYFDSSGYLLGGSSCSGGGGGGSGGGFSTSSPNLITTSFPNATGAMVGINSSTPRAILVVKGISGTTTPTFIVASSTNGSLLQVAFNGSTTLSSLGTGLVRSSSGSLYTDTTTYLTSALTSISALTGPVVHIATTSDTNILISVSTSTANTITLIPSFTGTLAAARLNANVVQGVTNDTNVTGTISAQNLTLGWTGTLADGRIASASAWNAKLTTVSTTTPITGSGTAGSPIACPTCVTSVTASGVLSSSGGTTPAITFTGLLPVANGGTGANNLTTGNILFGNGTSAVGTSTNFQWLTASNTQQITGTTTVSNAVLIGTTTLTSPFIQGQTPLAMQGTINNYFETNIQNKSNGTLASSDYTVTADNGTATTYYANFGINSSGFTKTSELSGTGNDAYITNSDASLIIATASTTNANALLKFISRGTIIATGTQAGFQFLNASTTGLTATSICLTGDVCRTTWPVGGSGSVSGGTIGFVTRWASSTGLTIGTLRDNGTVAGVNATSSTVSFNIQQTGALNPFVISSSTSNSYLTVLANGNVGIGTSTPAKPLEVWGTTAGGIVRFTRDVTTAIAPNTLYGTQDLTLYTSSSTVTTFPDLTGPTMTFSIATGTDPSTKRVSIADIGVRRDGLDTTGDIIMRAYNAGNLANSAFFQVQGSTTLPSIYVQGALGALTTFTVASSSGVSQFSVAGNGSTTVANLGTGCVGVSSGALYTTPCGSGSVSGSGTNGYIARWTSSSALSTGVFIDNGTVGGINATSSTVSLNVQGSTTLDPFNVSSSTGTSILRVTALGRVGIGTTTPISNFALQGTSGQTANLFSLASSSGSTLFSVTSAGATSINTSATSSSAFLITNPSGQTNLQVDQTAITTGLTIGTTTTSSLYSAGSLVIVGSTASTTMPYLLLASSTGESIFKVSNNATTTILMDNPITTKGTCLKLKDADGTGYTYVVANNGVLTASTGSCE